VVTTLVATLAVAACGGSGGTTGVLELQLGTVAAPGSLIARTAEEFARRVNERLPDRVRITHFGNSTLGSDEVMLQKLKLGTLDFAVPSTVMSSEVAAFGLFEMPYLVEDRDHMRRIGTEIFWPDLAPLAEARGYRVLGLWENGFRHITNNRRPIAAPADLKGIKLRTPRGEWRVALFQALGANPTPMPLTEVFVALQTGVIDGQENPLAQITSQRFQEVQKFLSLTGHAYTPAYLATGTGRWNRWPEDVRAVIAEEAGAVQEFAYTEAARMDAELLEQLRASGIAINESDRSRFLEAGRPIYEAFGAAVPGGRELVDRAIALAGAPATP
jgi:tripartite ATP-independent transporter DctP family solute receptor